MRQWDDHAMHADRLGSPEKRSKILRVVQGIEQQDKRLFILLICMFEDFDNVTVRIPADFRHHALVILVDLIQPPALCFFNRNVALFGHLQNIRQPAFFLRTFCDLDSEYIPAFCAECFIYCVTRIDEFLH
jgi:hypothetical protein